MPTLRERMLRDQLAAYLSAELSLDGFKDWLVGTTWDIDESGDHGAIDLAYDIKLSLAEHSSGRTTEAELQAELHLLLASVCHPADAALTP